MRPQKWRYASQFDTTMIASKGRPKSNPGTKAVIFITGHNGILTASKFLRSEQLLRILINVFVENFCKRLVMCLTTSMLWLPFWPDRWEVLPPPSKLTNCTQRYSLFKRLCAIFSLSSKQVEHTLSRNVSSWNRFVSTRCAEPSKGLLSSYLRSQLQDWIGFAKTY